MVRIFLTSAARGLMPAALAGCIASAGSAEAVRIGGPFELTAADGTADGTIVTEATYRGKWLLVFFGYTFCPDVCPTTLMVVADALEALGEDADRLQPIFITVDPERDTPDVMARYAASFDDRIVALSGTSKQIAAVAEAYGVNVKARKADETDRYYSVDHSTYLYFMDPDGEFIRGLDHDTPSNMIADTFREMIDRP